MIYPRVAVNQVAEEFNQCLANPAYCTAEMDQCLENRYTCPIKEYALLYRTEVESSVGTLCNPQQWRSFARTASAVTRALLRDVLPAGLMGLALASLMARLYVHCLDPYQLGCLVHCQRLLLPLHQSAGVRSKTDIRQSFVDGCYRDSWCLCGDLYRQYRLHVGALWRHNGRSRAAPPDALAVVRANAWTEISGMLVGFGLATANYLIGQTGGFAEGTMSIFPGFMASHPIHVMCWISLVSGIVSLVITLLTPPVNERLLREFAQKTHPMASGRATMPVFLRSVVSRCRFSIGYLAPGRYTPACFGIGYLLRLEYTIGILLLLACIVSMVAMIYGMSRIDQQRNLSAPMMDIIES